MYLISTKQDQVLFVEGYEVPRYYVDPIKIAKDREIELRIKSGKVEKDKRY